MKTTQPIRNKHQVRALADYYLTQEQVKNCVLIIMGLYTALRISDLLRLRWEDVYNFTNGKVRANINIVEKKTGKNKQIALNAGIIKALTLYSTVARPGAYVIDNKNTGKAISRIQAYRLIRAAAEALNFRENVSCHSLRKTFGYHAWKNGISPAVIMDIYNHSSMAITRRYLGVSQEDRDAVYLGLDLTA
jgi:integrase